MANICCVCGKKIGFMDGYKSIPETNEPVDVYGPPLPYEEAEESEIPAEGAGIG